MRPAVRAHQGMTLIELVVAIVIIGVGLAGLMLAFSTVAGASAQPIELRQMQAIADEMVAEIALKPYALEANAPATGCARTNFNDLSDYHGYTTTQQICSIDGSPIPSLNGYSVAVSVVEEPWLMSQSKLIHVTVTHAAESYELFRRRTAYAQ